MSRIPNKPLIKNTTTVSSKTPSGGTRTTTTTNIRELEQCGAAGRSRPPTGGCQPCPSGSGQKSIRRPQASTIRPSGAHQSTPMRSPALPPPTPQMRPLAAGAYNVPAQFGPMTRAGKGATFSSPAALRSQMEAKLPKGMKYGGVKGCPYQESKSRAALQGSKMGDTLAGSFNVYGGPAATSQELVDRSCLDQRMNQQQAEELFNMSSPEVTMVEEQAAQELLERSMIDPEDKVFAKSHHTQQVCPNPPKIQTPAGEEPVLQQTYMERRVERDDVAEKVVKNLTVTGTDAKTGQRSRITFSEQQLDPDYGLSSEGKDIITVKETVSVTPSYTSTVKDIVHESITPKITVDPDELARMVEEEAQDVESTLRMVPPDLPLQDDRYAAKKRLQRLRLTSESMILLEKSVVNPVATADEAMPETPPEALANIMHTIESGVTPECPPDQVFHTLFEEKTTEQSVILSSIGPGPLQDVVVPQVLTKDIHKESMTPDLSILTDIYKNVTDANDWPPVDIFASVMDEEAKSPHKEMKTRSFKPLQDEEMPWTEEDLEPLVNIVGAEPAVVLNPANVPDLETSGNLATELSHGIEYFVNADPVQYMSRVQLRGSHPPQYFPGYIYALPEFPDVVKLARCPDEVFRSSWKSCQPRLMPEDTEVSILH